MTVNERLITAGLMDAWYEAIRARHRGKLIAMLRKVQVARPEAIARKVILDSVTKM